MTTSIRDRIYDADLLLEDSLDNAGASSPIVASQAGKVLDVATYRDLGSGLVKGDMVVDVSALVVSTNDDIYTIVLQGSNTTAFTANVSVGLAQIKLGHTTPLIAAQVVGGTSVVGRYIVPFSNEVAGTHYRYVRAYTIVAGTGASITHKAWLTKES